MRFNSCAVSCLAVILLVGGVPQSGNLAQASTPQSPSPSVEANSAEAASSIPLKDWLETIGGVLGLITFGIGVYQYAVSQKWKRAEFVAEQIKEFEADPEIKNILLALDWNNRSLKFSDAPEECFMANDVLLINALSVKNNFELSERLLRDAFSELLDRLERFEAYIQAGLVSQEEFQPYLDYWLNILGNRESGRKPAEFYDALGSFLTAYSYQRARNLLARFGHTLPEAILPPVAYKTVPDEKLRQFMEDPLFTGKCPHCGAELPDLSALPLSCECGWVHTRLANIPAGDPPPQAP